MRLYTSHTFLTLLPAAAALAPASAEPSHPSDAEALRSAHQARRGEQAPPAHPAGAQPYRYSKIPSTVGVEPYIARTIERNARGDR